MYKRFKWNPEIRMEPDWQESLPKKPSRIFVGSTMELFGEWVDWEVWESIEQYVNTYPQHTFIFLTKRPENIIKHVFPKNCWVGVSATNDRMFRNAVDCLEDLPQVNKFISFEPLLEQIINIDYGFYYSGIRWVIVGQQTPISRKTTPKLDWILKLADSAQRAQIPLFLKNNLNSCEVSDYPELLDKNGNLRQEFPVLNP
jgi:protein gp37